MSGTVRTTGTDCRQVAKRADSEDAFFQDFLDFLDVFRMDVQSEYDVTWVMKAEAPV
jgi:hypothetical protein